MDWNVISAIATVIGTVLTFVSILVAISLGRKKNIPGRGKPSTKSTVRTDPIDDWARGYGSVVPDDEAISPYTPYLYVCVGLIGACGGVASIFVPWLLLEASPDLQFILYPLLVVGVIGGVALALVMDTGFEMGKVASPWLRFPLSAISGVIGGWLGLLVIVGGIIYLALTSEGVSSSRG